MAFPTEDEFLSFFDRLSNWGRWGADDRVGTLNLITDESRRRAAELVKTGRIISLSRNIDPDDPDPLHRGTEIHREMILYSKDEVAALHGVPEGAQVRLSGVRERVDLTPHGSNTHLDGLAHVSWNGMNYNGVPASAVDRDRGSSELSVHQASNGFITRGILLDVPAAIGVPWLEPGHPVTIAELEAAEKRQGVRVGEGDVLLLYTGSFQRIAAEGLDPRSRQPGYSAETLPWLRERDVALISSDCINDVKPSGFESKDISVPVHSVALVAMGLWLVDHMELDELAEACRELGRWEFFFAMLPWRFVGISASPVNPIAMF